MKHEQAGGSRKWLLPALLVAVAVVAATVLWLQGEKAAAPQDTPSVSMPSASVETTSPVPQPTTTVPPAVALAAAGPPRSVVVDSLGIDAPVVSIATEGTSLNPPDDPQVLGWWSGGSRPGDVQGSALITGHTVHDGGGALDELEEIRAGAPIEIQTANGLVSYVVESVAVLDKDTIARQAPQLFSQEVPGRLVLVTCEDWDGTGYRSNVVVTATPTA